MDDTRIKHGPYIIVGLQYTSASLIQPLNWLSLSSFLPTLSLSFTYALLHVQNNTAQKQKNISNC